MAEKDGLKTIGAKVAATRRRLGLLAFSRAFWPLFVFLILFLSMALAGAFDQRPAAMGAVLALLFLIGGAIFCYTMSKSTGTVSKRTTFKDTPDDMDNIDIE